MHPRRTPGRPTESRTELARLRKRLGLNQEEAAEICAALLGGCEPRTYRRWESAGAAHVPPVILAEFRRRAAA